MREDIPLEDRGTNILLCGGNEFVPLNLAKSLHGALSAMSALVGLDSNILTGKRLRVLGSDGPGGCSHHTTVWFEWSGCLSGPKRPDPKGDSILIVQHHDCYTQVSHPPTRYTKQANSRVRSSSQV